MGRALPVPVAISLAILVGCSALTPVAALAQTVQTAPPQTPPPSSGPTFSSPPTDKAATSTGGPAPGAAAGTAAGPVSTFRATPANANRYNPTGRKVVLVVPLRENGPLGEVELTITADDKLSLSEKDLENALGRLVRPEALAQLKAAATPDGQITPEAAAKLGFVMTYDPGTIEMVIQVPLAARLTRTVALGLGAENVVKPDRSDPFAAYLNYVAGEQYIISGPDRGDGDFVADLELSGRLFGVAFENFATVDQRADHTFERTSSRFIYDLPGPALRITGGDLITETSTLQSDPQIAGLNVSHLIDTFYPNTATSGVSSRTLSLTRASDVQILINNVPVTELHLQPGNYDLRNFPIAQGANNVQAVVTDDSGQQHVIHFNFFSDVNLLVPGLSEYTGSLGVLAPLGDDGPQYTSDLAFSGFYRRGLTEQITAGANLQATRYDQVVGLDGVLGTKIGVFALDASVNHLESGADGGAVNLLYRYASSTNSLYFARTFDVQVQYRTQHFADAAAYIPVDGFAISRTVLDTEFAEELIASANFNQPIRRNLSIQLSANYTKSYIAGQDTAGASAFLTYQAPLETTVGIGLSYLDAPRPAFGETDVIGRGFSAAITLTHRFGARSLVTAAADRFQQRVDYSRSALHPTGDFFANADFSHSNLGYLGDAGVGYETNRGNLEAEYNNTLGTNGSVTGQEAGLLWDGSVAFADGHFGLGRHITDSFAVIGEDPSLDGRQVLIASRFGNDTIAKSGLFGPAVLPFSSYVNQIVPYDVKDLPPGYDLGTGNFEVYPWLHSGFDLKVGTPYNVTAIGNLLDEDGKPVELRTGQAVSLTDKKAPKQEVITNRTGRFAAIGLSPGLWRITIPGDHPLVYDLRIERADGMLIRFGALRPGAVNRGVKR